MSGPTITSVATLPATEHRGQGTDLGSEGCADPRFEIGDLRGSQI